MPHLLSSLRVRGVDSSRIQPFKAIEKSSLLFAFLFLTPGRDSSQLFSKVREFYDQMGPKQDEMSFIQLFATGGREQEESGVKHVSEGEDSWYVGEGVDQLLQTLRAEFDVPTSGPAFIITDGEGHPVDSNAEDKLTTSPTTSLPEWLEIARGRLPPEKPPIKWNPNWAKKKPKRKVPIASQKKPLVGGLQKVATPVVAFGQFVEWTNSPFPSGLPVLSSSKPRRRAAEVKIEPLSPGMQGIATDGSIPQAATSGSTSFPAKKKTGCFFGRHLDQPCGDHKSSGFNFITKIIKVEENDHTEPSVQIALPEQFLHRLKGILLSRDADVGAHMIQDDWRALCSAVPIGQIDYDQITEALMSASLESPTKALICARFLYQKVITDSTPSGRLKGRFLSRVQEFLQEQSVEPKPAIIQVISLLYGEDVMKFGQVTAAIDYLRSHGFGEGSNPQIGSNCLFLIELVGSRLQKDPGNGPGLDYSERVLNTLAEMELPNETRIYVDEVMACRRSSWLRMDTKFGAPEKESDLVIQAKFRAIGLNRDELASLSIRMLAYMDSADDWDVTQTLCVHLLLEFIYHKRLTDETIFDCRNGFIERLTGVIEALIILADILEIDGLKDYVGSQLYERRCGQPCATCCGRLFFSIQQGLRQQDYNITKAAFDKYNQMNHPSLDSTCDLSAVQRATE